jgi:hypothetical protein
MVTGALACPHVGPPHSLSAEDGDVTVIADDLAEVKLVITKTAAIARAATTIAVIHLVLLRCTFTRFFCMTFSPLIYIVGYFVAGL